MTDPQRPPPAIPDFSREDRFLARLIFFGAMAVMLVLLAALALPHLRDRLS